MSQSRPPLIVWLVNTYCCLEGWWQYLYRDPHIAHILWAYAAGAGLVGLMWQWFPGDSGERP